MEETGHLQEWFMAKELIVKDPLIDQTLYNVVDINNRIEKFVEK